jgi:NADPH2:quinone reductase
VTAPIPPATIATLAARLGDSLPVGNEGAGTVLAAGTSNGAQSLLGKTVGVVGGAMYSQYRCVPVSQCLDLPDGVTAAEGASWFVNPMTVLGLVGTMRLEGHSALVHTAAASNLGQMLNRLCLADGVGLVNIVRSVEQEQLLRSAGAEHVCNSTAAGFMDDLTAAIAATGATIAFDAVGGGRLASQILSCMEAALLASASEYSRYGSATHKQVYVYGNLDRGPTELDRTFGMAWGVGGWLLVPYLARVGGEELERMRQRVAVEITTTFASSYTRQVSLVDALSADAIMGYAKQATGEKYLVMPNA